MDETRKGYLTGLKSFKSKKGDDCYIASVMIESETNANRIGCFDAIDVWLTKEVFDKLYEDFEFFQAIDLTARISGNRIFWNLAS